MKDIEDWELSSLRNAGKHAKELRWYLLPFRYHTTTSNELRRIKHYLAIADEIEEWAIKQYELHKEIKKKEGKKR